MTEPGPAADSNSYRFSTKYFDEETSLYYYGYRYYSPALGKWLNKDPYEESGGLNLYEFVGNNPVNFRDPHGLVLVADDLAIIGLVTLTTMTVAYLETPAGQDMLRNSSAEVARLLDPRPLYDYMRNNIDDLIREIEEEAKRK